LAVFLFFSFTSFFSVFSGLSLWLSLFLTLSSPFPRSLYLSYPINIRKKAWGLTKRLYIPGMGLGGRQFSGLVRIEGFQTGTPAQWSSIHAR
jgi:hypothetical protein